MEFTGPKIIEVFARHKVAANLFMAIMILSGLYALTKLNIQFLPTYDLDVITVSTKWSGATAEDIQTRITIPIEQELLSINNVKEITSESSDGLSKILIEFNQGSDLSTAFSEVKDRVSSIRNLPQNIEPPIVSRLYTNETIATMAITYDGDITDLRQLLFDIKQELFAIGIKKVAIYGMPQDEISIQVPIRKIAALKMSLPQIGAKIRNYSLNVPGGTLGYNKNRQSVRSLSRKEEARDFFNIPLSTTNNEKVITVADIADIKVRPKRDQSLVTKNGKPTILIDLQRSPQENALTMAKIFDNWLVQKIPTLPSTIKIYVLNQRWQLIKERINLLLKNGLGGLILVTITLFLFLNYHVALWVTIGIPVSFLAAIFFLYGFGGSINMISLFGLIMALGVIVDDAIVVGEESLTQFTKTRDPVKSVLAGAYRMLAPVSASSLTTIAAFFPLLIVGGVMGTIMFELPLIVICVILASLIESFFILPGHLLHTFEKIKDERPLNYRIRLDNIFNNFRENTFRPFVHRAIHSPVKIILFVFSLLILSMGLIIGKRVQFNFFPSPEMTTIDFNVQFTADTPKNKVIDFMKSADEALNKTNQQFGGNIVKDSYYRTNQATFVRFQPQLGANMASMFVELSSPDQRKVSNDQFVEAWKKNIPQVTGIENLLISKQRVGPPGTDIDILITGQSADILKQAAQEIKRDLGHYSGVYNIKDDIPIGIQQQIFAVNNKGKSLGLTTENLANQIRAAFDGDILQIHNDLQDEVEVRISLPDDERDSLNTLANLPIVINKNNQNNIVLLGSVAEWKTKRSMDILRNTNSQLSVHVIADVDSSQNNTNDVLAQLSQNELKNIANKYNIKFSFSGKNREQEITINDMKSGAILAFGLIYIILAWVFSSYMWPVVVLTAIPFGIIGAIFGHYLMGIDFTLLSLFGIFSLSGIVINDSIILITYYRQIKDGYESTEEAITEASCQRLRAVLLTSITTIAGLSPLLFETSVQAQFLIPMATSISFGLAASTVLILIVVPTLLNLVEKRK